MDALIAALCAGETLREADFARLLEGYTPERAHRLAAEARKKRETVYGKAVYIRGLIEISNYCRNDCLYCGIRRSNKNCDRYRLTKEDILECCAEGYDLGFRTFVMQGGEDGFYTDEILCSLIKAIKGKFPDCAVTLSLGERSKESYQRLFDAGMV